MRCELCGEKEPCHLCSGVKTYKAMVTFECKKDYDNFLILMSSALDDGHLIKPFNIQRFVVNHNNLYGGE